ncbi:hypothetical protein HD599_000776 [Conyzicola lurida]|uniref:Mannosyltransferase PIG-V n=1 Tax=Conyzicola lurida TaxID=1172621 RepID=A0A841ALE7_9MICO|nr:hypothetical protein [Conyzicola lurida]
MAADGLRFDALVGPPSTERRRRSGLAVWAAVRYRLTPWWARVLVVFVASRVVTTAIMLWFASRQQYNAWSGAHPSYLEFAKFWDGNWYYIIAVSGYPDELPVTAEGHVSENAWAFMPGYPAVVRGLMFATGLDYRTIAVVVSVAFALGTALLFYRLMNLVLPSGTALFAVVLYCFAPLSPMLQVAYAESMHAFFLTLALYLLLKRDYWRLLPVVVVMSLTRPSGLAFALAMGLHVVHRWVTRERDPFGRREVAASVTVVLVSVISGFAWLLIAAAVTGSWTAYTDTELAWRAAYIGYQELIPLTPWILGANWWLPGGLGIVLLVLLVVAFTAFMFSPWVKRLGPDIRYWVASYALYLLAVFFPQSSTFRLLMPVFPLWGAIAQPRSWIYRLAVVLLCIAGQIGWIHIAWWSDGYDWTPP